MKRTFILTILLAISLVLAACVRPDQTPSTPTQTPPPAGKTSGLLISEVQAGVSGNNNLEFIEIYNAGDQIADLKGWTLWYRLPTSQEDLLVYRWKHSALVPPHGHFLLGRNGQDLGITPDATFEQAINTTSGGLALRSADKELADSLGWGKAPAVMTEGSPAPALENGSSLERLPGGNQGNNLDADNNLADFVLNPVPQPQNSGSTATPAGDQGLALALDAPAEAQPGSTFSYRLSLTNGGGQTFHQVQVRFPVPAGLDPGTPDGELKLDENTFVWDLPAIQAGETQEIEIPIKVPWTYLTAMAVNYYARAEDWSSVAFGGPVTTRIEGGVIPIGTARGLPDAELVVEGIATMYTGGYFAGGGNTKFYLQDESGGLQVQVFGGEGLVNVSVGARVRVKGQMGAYRGSIQIVPDLVPDDVQIVTPPEEGTALAGTEVSIQQAASDLDTLPGQLISVTGLATRIEEFTYSYEIDLADDSGHLLTLYVDKLTHINVEALKENHLYRASGISEVRDGEVMLYPRFQSDLVEVFPPVLLVSGHAPATVLPGEIFTTTLTVFNHTPNTMTGLQINASLPQQFALLDKVLDGGQVDGQTLNWNISELEGNGSSLSVRYRLTADPAAEFGQQITTNIYSATAVEWPQTATGEPLRTFIGDQVPIWAIQGTSNRSPYLLEQVSTQGVVTGVFDQLPKPGEENVSLGGFWIQQSEPDNDPQTSDGIFISIPGQEADLAPGDIVHVSGLVREPSQQTAIEVASLDDISVLGHNDTLPEPVILDPPQDAEAANAYYEAREGMLVSVQGPAVAVSPVSKYGEYVLVLETHGVNRLWQGDENGYAIMVDDGSYATHSDRSTLPYLVSSGDEVSNVVGPLAFTYGRYKIEPLQAPEITPHPPQSSPLPEAGPAEFNLMTWNVENLFDTRDPHPSSPPRPRPAEYQRDLAKAAATIKAAGAPLVVALQEVENIGVLESIAAQPDLAPYQYQAVLIEGSDSRGIDVGYLVRSDRATILEVQQFPAPEGLTSRPPLLLKVEIDSEFGPATFYVINNHFSSMSGGVEATEPRRTAQAAWNVKLLQDVLADDPQAMVAIVGDLNSYYDSLPINTLRDAGLVHVFESWDDPQHPPYTYIFQGESQTLDHILLTPAFNQYLQRVDVLHVNADYPPMAPDDTSPERKSDHDPVVATFSLAP